MALVGEHGSVADGRPRTVTLLFSDLEGSTRLLADLGDAYTPLLARYHDILATCADEAGGWVVGTEGDGVFAAFETASGALAATAAAQQSLAAEPWPGGATVRARMGLHSGEAAPGPGGLVGLDVHRAARIAAAAHGGQVLVSDAVRGLAEHNLPSGAGLRDLGPHRLKDLAEPQRLHQVVIEGLPAEFPAPRTLDAVPNNLPAQLSSFVGREPDLARAGERLEQHRLVTLTGPGGTGKTRLSLQLAAQLLGQFADGVWFVRLAPIRDPRLVPTAILSALAVPEAATREPAEQLLGHLGMRELLLVLDNFEQVLDAAPLVGELLAAAPGVRVLVTSRSPLHLSGEQELPVPPLGVPDLAALPPLESLSQYDAVALFVQRATAVKPDFAVTSANAPAVAEICARLDGLPLAIELAAARVKILPPEAVLPRLEHRLSALGTGARDLPDRHQTLRGTIQWSFELLEADHQRLFAGLGVFVDGWALEHADAVLGDRVDLLDGVAALVDHSLVRQRDSTVDARFGMLETIREFAVEQLAQDADSDAVRDRHAHVFLGLAEEAAPHLLGSDQAAWVTRLTHEYGNLRAAHDRVLDRRDAERALRLGAALWRFWQKRHVHEGRQRVEAALAIAGEDVAPEHLSAGLEAAGGLAYWAGDMKAAGVHYDRALAIERSMGRPDGIANALYNRAFPIAFGGIGLEAGETLALEALEAYTRVGDAAGVAKARWAVGTMRYMLLRYDEAAADVSAALETAVGLDDVFLAHWSRHILGLCRLRQGDHDVAEALLAEALAFFAEVGDVSAVTLLLDDFAELACARGMTERQARLAAASRALQQTSGSELSRVSASLEGRAPLDPETLAAAWAEGLAMTMEQAVAYALDRVDAPPPAPTAGTG